MFCNLNDHDDQLDYPVIYAVARYDWALNSLDDDKPRKGAYDLLEAMIEYIPESKVVVTHMGPIQDPLKYFTAL